LELDGSANNNREREHMRDGARIGVDINTGADGEDGKNENCLESMIAARQCSMMAVAVQL